MKKWLTIHIPILIVILAAHISIALVIQENANERVLIRHQINDQIEKYANHEVSSIDISACTKFEWDRFFIFGPYSSAKKINSVLGSFWIGSHFTDIESNEAITLFVFMNHGHVVKYLEFPRGPVDFSTAYHESGYTVENAIFTLDTRGRIIWQDGGE
jgi:hypothetical protein